MMIQTQTGPRAEQSDERSGEIPEVRARCSVFPEVMVMVNEILLPHPGSLNPILQYLGMLTCWGYFLRAQKPLSSPGFILGRVTGILQLKLRSSWEWSGACFWKSSHYLGNCFVNIVNDREVEKNWSCGEYRVLSIGVGVQGGLSTYKHTPRSILGPGTESPLQRHRLRSFL